MAVSKRQTTVRATRATSNDSTHTEETRTLSAATKRLVDDIREPFRGFVGEMGALLITRAKLAPKFMRAAVAWQKDTGSNFVSFVRELDPSVPMKQADYRNNAVYNAAIYLKRLVDAENRGAGEEKRKGPPPIPPLTGLAMLLAAIRPLVPEDNLPKLWDIIADQLHWSEDQRKRLENLVDEAAPLLAVRAPSGQPRPVLRIVAPRHTAVA